MSTPTLKSSTVFGIKSQTQITKSFHPILKMSTHPHTLENLAESIYEDIVSANFRDLERSDEQVVYAIACERAQVEYNDLVHDYINGL